MATNPDFARTVAPNDEAVLDRLLLASPNLSSIRNRLPEMTSSQKQALLDRLQTLQTSSFRSPRIRRYERSAVPPPSVAALSDEAVLNRLTEFLSRRDLQNPSSLRERVSTLNYAQRRELLQQLLNRSCQGFKAARLSYAQQRCFFFDQLAPGNGSQNITTPVRVKGPIDLALAERCINVIVQRHEALRTNFRQTPDGPIQVIAPKREIKIVETAIHLEDSAEREALAIDEVRKEAYAPFDLSSEALIRVNSVRVAKDDRLIVLTMHHIISDQWSTGLFLKELGVLYTNGADPNILPTLPIQYADYAEWQLEKVTPDTIAPELEYWSRNLQDAHFNLELPTDYPRPRVKTTNGSVEQMAISRSVFQRITALAQSEQASLFMTLLGAFNLLLAIRAGKNDIVIGTDCANRNRAETEPLIGLFVNGLVLRNNLSGDPSFREILRRVRRSSLDALSHPDLPFQWLVEHLKPVRDPGRTPLYQIVFDLLNIPLQIDFGGVMCSPLRLPLRPAKYDLTMFVRESPHDLRASIEYNTDLYSRATALAFLRDYEAMLDFGVNNPDAPLSRFRRHANRG